MGMSSITNQDNIASLINKRLTYTTSNSGNTRKYIIKSIDRIGDGFAVCKVIDKSDDKKSEKQVWKTLRFDGISSLSHCGALVR
jgi:hypothetical protein